MKLKYQIDNAFEDHTADSVGEVKSFLDTEISV